MVALGKIWSRALLGFFAYSLFSGAVAAHAQTVVGVSLLNSHDEKFLRWEYRGSGGKGTKTWSSDVSNYGGMLNSGPLGGNVNDSSHSHYTSATVGYPPEPDRLCNSSSRTTYTPVKQGGFQFDSSSEAYCSNDPDGAWTFGESGVVASNPLPPIVGRRCTDTTPISYLDASTDGGEQHVTYYGGSITEKQIGLIGVEAPPGLLIRTYLVNISITLVPWVKNENGTLVQGKPFSFPRTVTVMTGAGPIPVVPGGPGCYDYSVSIIASRVIGVKFPNPF